MAATIKIKNSSTTGAVPTSGDLVQGELAVNVTDTGLYTENASGTVVKLNAPSIDDKNTGATKHLTISTGGNLGLGVTPSAWGASIRALEGFQTTGSWSIASGGGLGSALNIQNNAFFDGSNWIYKGSLPATNYYQNAGAHVWRIAASGTAGNAITFTQAMTLDASGRLGIGTTSPAQKLDVVGSARLSNSDTTQTQLFASNSAGSTEMGVFPSGIGYYGTTSNTALTFYTNSSERARIDTSGNLLVGTTSPDGKLCVQTSGNSYGVVSVNSTVATTSSVLFQGYATTSTRFLVYGNGNVVNTNNSYGAISDSKLKENIVDATPKLEKLNQVRVVNYNLIGDQNKQLGVVAQELEQVFPSMVEETPDRDAEGNDLGTTTKSVKYSVFVPMLIKAIQEQQTIINAQQAVLEQLTARITALEA